MEKKFIDLHLTPESLFKFLGIHSCGEISGLLLATFLKRKAIISAPRTSYTVRAVWYDYDHSTLHFYSGIKGMTDVTIYFFDETKNKERVILSVKEKDEEGN